MNIGGVVIDGHPNRDVPLPTPAIDDMDLGSGLPYVTPEPSLGNPPVDGYILSSKQSGERSWISPSVGGGGSSIYGYEKTKDLVIGTTRFTTPLMLAPVAVTLFDSTGKIMENMGPQVIFTGGVYVVDVDSAEVVPNVTLKIIAIGVITDIIIDDMKYLQIVNLAAGTDTSFMTTLTDEPYTIEFFDSTNKMITSDLGDPVYDVVAGFYQITVYNGGGLLSNVKCKIIY